MSAGKGKKPIIGYNIKNWDANYNNIKWGKDETSSGKSILGMLFGRRQDTKKKKKS